MTTLRRFSIQPHKQDDVTLKQAILELTATEEYINRVANLKVGESIITGMKVITRTK